MRYRCMADFLEELQGKKIFSVALCLCDANALPETRAPKLLPEIRSIKFDDPAHLVEPRSHALADPVAQSLVTRRSPWPRNCSRGLIVKIRRNNRRPVVVVASIQDQADRIPHPFGRLDCPQLIEYQHLSIEYRTQHIQLRRLHGNKLIIEKIASVVDARGNVCRSSCSAPLRSHND